MRIRPLAALAALLLLAGTVHAQGVTTSGLSGFVFDEAGQPIPGANVVAVHTPSGTRYATSTRVGGAYALPNLRIGGPYTVTATFLGYQDAVESDLQLQLGQTFRLDLTLSETAVGLDGVTVEGVADEVLASDRTGASTYIDAAEVATLPTVNRSTRDLTRVDPRSDGNFSFGGRNWLYNNVTLDGSYFNNAFGLDDPSPGGQAGAEPVPYDAIEQVQVSIAPYDVRESGFTGASVNQVTKSGTNRLTATAYTFYRNEDFVGNTVSGNPVIANPDLSFSQIGLAAGGPIVRDKLFVYVNGELSRRDDPGTNFVANRDGTLSFGESRVQASDLDAISARLRDGYGYETGGYDDYLRATDNDKLLAKLNWNVNDSNELSLRYNYLDAFRDLTVNPAAISFANAGRGPNESSLPFENAGYRINNELHSVALELNSRFGVNSNRFFASYSRFRDFREPKSAPFPTIEIVEGGVTYTTAGHEPFSIRNILDQDVLQITNNLTLPLGQHIVTGGANFEYFSFFNSFNLFRHGLFQLPYFLDFEGDGIPNGSTFFGVDQFLAVTDPDLPLCGPGADLFLEAGTSCRVDLNGMVTSESLAFKGETIDVGQVGVYVQDEWLVSPQLSLTLGLRVDAPFYVTEPVANPFSTGLTALDENDAAETVDQAELPGAALLFSPRLGFNYAPGTERSTQVRGGTGIFTGRVPFVWIGNVISNPGANPNLPGAEPYASIPEDLRTSDEATLQQSFDLNAMDDDFRYPQVWTTNLAVDQRLPGDALLTLEGIFGKDLNAVYIRNADLRTPVRTLADGRPYFGGTGAGEQELNPDGGAGIYVIDSSSEGYNLSLTAQLRKAFGDNLNLSGAYAYTQAENLFSTTEIASVLWGSNPVQGDPNRPQLAPAQFGQPHRIIGTALYRMDWSEAASTSVGVFATLAKGNQFLYAGGNRYSFTYSGDVNGDGSGGNDLIYIPASAGEIRFSETDGNGAFVGTAADQYAALDRFIRQDAYLSANRGSIAERNGAVNPWYSSVDLRLLQDLSFLTGDARNTLQLSLDVQNVANLISSDWGVRKVASPAATSPLSLVGFDGSGEPLFNFTGPAETFVDDPSEFSRWRAQVGIRYRFN
ncbi:carboxypeptidase regulatory-like domain-containing protein [Rubrivirga sp. IMCC45206]|uniref:TonB-dependent receptor n=1 Tax=Rubrivirga sp. IMCC45206 TaxID=3391614 RepID=UPI0039902BEC